MIRTVWRGAIHFLRSMRLAVGLLAFVGVWSIVATAVPQGPATASSVIGWATKNGALEPLVRVLGLHSAFTAPLFVVCVALLALSTAACSWSRTKVAVTRARLLRAAASADESPVVGRHGLEIACRPGLSAAEALTIVAESLKGLGIKAGRRDGVISAVSAPWAVWGSTLFHWALLVFMVAAFVGTLQRSEGQMAVAVGQTRADAPASYLALNAGPWHDWSRVGRSIRVDSLDPDFTSAGIDRGAVPTVSVLDGAGTVLVTQRVYPNMKLHSGSLSINAPSVGLAVTLASVGSGGATGERIFVPVDFSQTASGGTVPLGALSRRDAAGNVVMRLSATVPLDRVDGHYGEWIPKQPVARLIVTAGDGTGLLDRTVRPGEDVTIPGGGVLRLVSVGWYSRLSLVDDPTIPFIYASMIAAMLGLALSLVARQQLLVAAAVERPDGTVSLAMDLRLWRNTTTNRHEIESVLTEALRGDTEEGMS